MNIEQVKKSLQSHAIFANLSDHELLKLCDGSILKEFNVGEALIKEEVPNHFLFLIIDGEVVVKSYGIKIRKQFKGSLMGEISAAGLGSATEDSATVEVVASTQTKALCFPITVIREIINSNNEFSEALYNAAMSRLLS